MAGDSLLLEYDLVDLPTAQHRAGLAGLAVVVDTLTRRGVDRVPSLDYVGTTGLRLALNEESLLTLFNDLYDATTEEARQYSARKDRGGASVEPIRTETETRTDARTGKVTSRTVYFYPQVVPRAPFLDAGALGMPPAWLKLWRDAVWSTLRGIPKTRGPFEDRAAGLKVREASSTWVDLVRHDAARRKGRLLTTEVSSAVLVGAQASNAERVPFLGRPDHNLLLHFWPVVMGVGEAWQIKLDGDRVTEEPIGYVLTVPDVTALSEFVRDFAAEVATLSTAMAGYRPRDAVLALPEEGGLDYLTKLSAGRALRGETRFSVAGVEVYHLAKQGNNIRLLATGRVPARRDLVRQFEAIGRTRNLLFRAQLIRNLLAQRPWYDGFDRIFARYDLGLFMGGAPDGFAASARRRFRQEFGLLARGEVDRERVQEGGV